MLGAGALLLAVALGVLIARSISRPLAEVQQVAERVAREDLSDLAAGMDALARGDLTRAVSATVAPPTYRSRDEIGLTAGATRLIISTVHETIAAYESARQELRTLISRVAQSSAQVDAGAGQLTQVSGQIGQASTQIARAIEEVAHGAGAQSQNAAAALEQLTQLRGTVGQMSEGAGTQSAALRQVEGVMAELLSALGHTRARVEAVTAHTGGQAVT